MKKIYTLLLSAIMLYSPVFAKTVTDVYDLTVRLHVPHVLNNTTSQGYRKYKSQLIKGYMTITYDTQNKERPVIDVFNLVNKSFKIRGNAVTYESQVNSDDITTRLVLIGNNKTGKFTTASTCFYVEAYPSYALGEMEEDNSFYILFAGKGTTKTVNNCKVINKLSGYVTGTQGCSCYAYGHISPTRLAGYNGATDIVEDVACVYGTWTAKYNKTYSRKTAQIIIR